jgi:hypothetical protein
MIMFVTIGTALMMVWRILYSYPRIQAITVLITDLALLLVTCVVALASLIQCIRRRHHEFGTTLSSISHVDEIIPCPFENAWKSAVILQASEVSYFVLYEVIFCCFQYTVWANEHRSKNPNHIPISCGIHAVICIAEIQFFNLVSMLERRFSALNSHFGSVVAPRRTLNRLYEGGLTFRTRTATEIVPGRHFEIDVAAKSHSTREWQQDLYKLRCVNDVLSDAVTSVSSGYGLQILLSLSIIFMSVTTSLYFAIGFAAKLREDEGNAGQHQRALVFSLTWAAVGIFRTFAISSSCRSVSAEAARTSVLLQKLLLEPSVSPEAATEIQLFLQQSRIGAVKFTAWDFFTLGHTTMFSFIGATVTYLVILLQFHG